MDLEHCLHMLHLEPTHLALAKTEVVEPYDLLVLRWELPSLLAVDCWWVEPNGHITQRTYWWGRKDQEKKVAVGPSDGYMMVDGIQRIYEMYGG
jgi:hypothetical protein